MPDQLQRIISEKLTSFTQELVELYRTALMGAVSQIVGESAPVRRGPGRPGKSRSLALSAAPTVAPKRGKRGRRSSAQITALAEKIHKYVVANPGKRGEEIKKALSIPTNQWLLPIGKLLESRKLRTTGARRATKYFPK
jgi:hypothetical protein